MSFETLFCVYFVNAVLLIDHEIDSAYWQEWNLFPALKPYGVNGFLIVHIPLLIAILAGLVLVYVQSFWGLLMSMALSGGGIFAFAFHSFYLRQGRPEFNALGSKILLAATLAVSIAQAALSTWLLVS